MPTISFDEKVVVTDPEMVEKMKRDIEGESMERLTYQNGNGEWCIKNNHRCAIATCSNDDGKYYIGEPIDRLAELEDKIENGTLVELPCKIGVPVYSIEMDFNGWETEWYIIKIGFSIGFLNDWGKYVFATREEAEKRLEELKK